MIIAYIISGEDTYVTTKSWHAALTQPLTHSSCDSVFLLHVIDLSASAGSEVVVITANAWSDEQSYLSVVQTNVDMYRGIIPRLAQLSPKAVLLVTSQPGSQTQTRHLLAQLLLKYSRDWPFLFTNLIVLFAL